MRRIETVFAYLGLTGGLATLVFSLGVMLNLVISGAHNPNIPQTAATEILPASAAIAGTKPTVSKQAIVQTRPSEGQAENAVAVTAMAVSTSTANIETPDPVAGKKVFKKCKACHTVEKGGKTKTGPNLWSILNSPVAANDKYKYSTAMKKQAGKTWDIDFFDEYLTKPKKAVKGTKMAFAGLKKPDTRQNLIAYLAQQSDNPIAPEALFAATGGNATEAVSTKANEAPAAETAAATTVKSANLAQPSPEEIARIEKAVAQLKNEVGKLDYERARFHPLHFQPQIEKASDGECLVCHEEIMNRKPRETSPAGVAAKGSLAWYQTLDTYTGNQETFHFRHLQSAFAKQTMHLSCNFCHKGNDPREESPDALAAVKVSTASGPKRPFTLRKMVNPTQTCLRCHGAMPDPENIMGLEGTWHQARVDFEDEETPNGCLSCHEETFRTVRHQVTYLKAANIEEAAKASSDVCYGCHGGRKWYRIAYPYPRNPWPDMDTEETPEWAVGRPTQSEPQFQIKPATAE